MKQYRRTRMGVLLACAIGALVACAVVPARAQDPRPWRVWQKDSPCSGNRYEWVTVATDNPGGGTTFYEIFPGSHSWATKAEAEAEAREVSASPRFSQYCCHDFSVYQYPPTGTWSVVTGEHQLDSGWVLRKSGMCCDEAYAYAGLSDGGNCGPSRNVGCGVGLKWEEEEAGWRSTWTRRGDSHIFDASYTGPSGQKASTVNQVTVIADRVIVQRMSSSDRNLCSYTGQLAADGISVSGTYQCQNGGTRPWSAKIYCLAAAPKDPNGPNGPIGPTVPKKPAERHVDFAGVWTMTERGPQSCGGDRFVYTLSLGSGTNVWEGTLTIEYKSECNIQSWPNKRHTIKLVQGAYPGSARIFEDGEDTGNNAIYYKATDSISLEGIGSFSRK